MTYKEQLYYLLREFKNGNYTTRDFCNQFELILNTELEYSELNATEYELFSILADISERYSPYEEDLKIPNCYFNENDVRKKVAEVCKILNI